jgi:hypothetical protein
MRDEELALRFFAFQMEGLGSYRTPLKAWLNTAAKNGRALKASKIRSLSLTWESALDTTLHWFAPSECFRRAPFGTFRAVNRALFDLTMNMASVVDPDAAHDLRRSVRSRYERLCGYDEFSDLISRAVDHKKRTDRRFEIWRNTFDDILD